LVVVGRVIGIRETIATADGLLVVGFLKRLLLLLLGRGNRLGRRAKVKIKETVYVLSRLFGLLLRDWLLNLCLLRGGSFKVHVTDKCHQIDVFSLNFFSSSWEVILILLVPIVKIFS
jgi:hypothetical protein